MKRKKQKSSSVWDFFSHFIPLFAFLCLLLNSFVIYFFERDRKPQVVWTVYTNLVDNVSFPSVVSPSVSAVVASDPSAPTVSPLEVSKPISVYNIYFDYFIYEGRRAVEMFGRHYTEGALTSYGRIKQIFPDRIFLENGDILVNTKWLNYNGSNEKLTDKGGKNEH